MARYYHLFPFVKVKRGSRVVLYGGGEVGQWYLTQLNFTGYARVVAIADKKWASYSDLGVPVISPENIILFNYDYVIISIENEEICGDVAQYLESSLGIDADKILFGCNSLAEVPKLFKLGGYDGQQKILAKNAAVAVPEITEYTYEHHEIKKKVCFAVGISSDWAFAAANVAIGINKYSKKTEYDIVILHNGITKLEQEALARIPHTQTRYVYFDKEYVSNILATISTGCMIRRPEDMMRFSSFEVFRLLREYENVVWVDADVLIQECIDDIIKWGPVAMAKDGDRRVRDQFVDVPELPYNMNISALKSNLMIFNDSIPYERIYDYCKKMSIKLAKYLKCTDQAILNLAVQEFKLNPKVFSGDWIACVTTEDENSSMAKIVHFGLETKPWIAKNSAWIFPEWTRNYRMWKENIGVANSSVKWSDSIPNNVLLTIRGILQKCGYIKA